MAKKMKTTSRYTSISDKYRGRLRCPRCKKQNIVEYEETFDCVNCCCEFDKKEILNARSEEDFQNILSFEEKLAFLRAFKKEGESDEAFARRLSQLDEDSSRLFI